MLLPLIKLRLVTSIAMSSATILADPDNEEYLLVHARPAMKLLQELHDIPLDEAVSVFQAAVNAAAASTTPEPAK